MREIIKERCKFMETSFNNRIHFKLGSETKTYSTLEIDDYDSYGLNERASWLRINEFQGLGWPDPLPVPLAQVRLKNKKR